MIIAIVTLSLLFVFASAKALQYKAQIEKIQKSTWAVFDDMETLSPTETLDNLMRKIWHALYD
jgi:hypothetical protein|nr:MAG TPA: hypothetical protein [Caudoviricetes sp.]